MVTFDQLTNKNLFKLDMKILYKFLTNYRQILHVSDIKLCTLLTNSETYLFLAEAMAKFKSIYSEDELKCPFQVNSVVFVL